MNFVSFIFKTILDWILGKVLSIIAQGEKKKADHDKAVNEINQDHKKIEEVTPDTPSEKVDEAIDDELNHF